MGTINNWIRATREWFFIAIMWICRIAALILLSPVIIFIGFLQLSHKYFSAFWGKNFTIDDEVFGTITFIEDNENSYWETEKVYFTPKNSNVSLLIEASKKGPSIKQKEFYKDIETNYVDYFDTILYPFMQSEIGMWLQMHHISYEELKKSMVVESITIPRFRGKYFRWDITFTTQYDQHYFTIELKNWSPINIKIDG